MAQQDLQTLMHLMDLSEIAEGKAKQNADRIQTALEDEPQVLASKLRDIYRQQGREISDEAIQAGVNSYLAQRHQHEPKGTTWVRFVGRLWIQRTALAATSVVILALISFATLAAVVVHSNMRANALERAHSMAKQIEDQRKLWRRSYNELAKLSAQSARDQRLIQLPVTTLADRNRQSDKAVEVSEKGSIEELEKQFTSLVTVEQTWKHNADVASEDLHKATSLYDLENRYRYLIAANAAEKDSPHAAETEAALKEGNIAVATQAIGAIESDIKRKQSEADNARKLAAAKARVAELQQKLSVVAKDPEPVQRFEREVKAAGDNAQQLNKVADNMQKSIQWIAKDYTYRIVMRQGQKTAFVRTEHDSRAKAYYVIVEAIDAFGNAAEKPVVDRETQRIVNTKMWGEEITADDYEQIKNEKLKKATLSQPVFAVKQAGYEEPQEFNYHAQHRQATHW
jgi:Family of unknown function (DUF6384)